MSSLEERPYQDSDEVWWFAVPIGLLLGLFSVLWVYFGMLGVGKPLSFRTAVLAGLPDWLLWASLTRPVFMLGERYRLSRESWRSHILFHVIAGAMVATFELFLVTLFNHFFYYNPWDPAPQAFGDAYLRTVLRYFHFAFIIYWLIIAAAHARWYYRSGQRRELEAARLREQVAQLAALANRAQLDALRAQLQPHFLFNALNAVSGVVREQRTELAAELISDLSLLLRNAMATEKRDLTVLAQELELLESYVAIERARFRERLCVTYAIESAALAREVPTMLLQPLVENAIRHGFTQTPRQLTVAISARALSDRTTIQVVDDGKGLAVAHPNYGIGLSNTRERLRALYGDGALLDIYSRDTGGTICVVHLPMHAPNGNGRSPQVDAEAAFVAPLP